MLQQLTAAFSQVAGAAAGTQQSQGQSAAAGAQPADGAPSSLGQMFAQLNQKFDKLTPTELQHFQHQQATALVNVVASAGPEVQAALGISAQDLVSGPASGAAAQSVAGAAQSQQAAATQATGARVTTGTPPADAAAAPARASESSATARVQGAGRYTPQSVHLAQFRGKFNTDGPAMAPNCGPTSVVMALRMAGLDVPGANGSRSQAVIDKVRIMGTGRNDQTVGTTDTELERAIVAAGGRYAESQDMSKVLSWIRQGVPVVLSGNPWPAWNQRYSHSQIYQFNGAHWVAVTGYNQANGKYIVNDPLSQIGAIEVSEAELIRYANGNGHLGIAVSK